MTYLMRIVKKKKKDILLIQEDNFNKHIKLSLVHQLMMRK